MNIIDNNPHRSALLLAFWVTAAVLPAKAVYASSETPIKVPLWPDKAPDDKKSPVLRVYLASSDKANGAAVIVCPGGSYRGHVQKHEGDVPAKWLNKLGVAGIVLPYRIGAHPAALEDGQRAIQVARASAKEWGLDTSRIGIMGFSAGGHVASSVGTHFTDTLAKAPDSISLLSRRPAFQILIYPVISFDLGWGPPKNVVGNPPDAAIMAYLANEKHVSPQTPPAFLAHAENDRLVPPANSRAFYDSCVAHNVPAELKIYPHGGHGFFPYDSTISIWAKDGDNWLRKQGFYNPFFTGCTNPKAPNYNPEALNPCEDCCDPVGVRGKAPLIVDEYIKCSRGVLSLLFQGEFSMTIQDINGKALWARQCSGPLQYSLSGMQAGVHIVNVTVGNKKYSRKVILF